MEATNKAYPGYVNLLNGKRASWAVMILPQLEHSDLYRVWAQTPPIRTGGAYPTNTHDGTTLFVGATAMPSPYPFAPVSVFDCPDRVPVTFDSNPLSFAVNTGSVYYGWDNRPTSAAPGTLYAWPEDANSGVFFNQLHADDSPAYFNDSHRTGRFGPFKPATKRGPRTRNDFISANDGTTYTLMMAERLQSASWASDPVSGTLGGYFSDAPFVSDFQVRQQTGFVWYVSNTNGGGPAKDNDGGNSNVNGSVPAGINAALAAALAVGTPLQPPMSGASNGGNGDGLCFSVPGSFHPGGANMTFCDGHLQFIADDIPYSVYTQLMTPAQRSAIITPSGKTVNAYNQANKATPDLVWTYLLRETDY